MTPQHPAQKSRLTPPTGQTRRCPQPACDSSAPGSRAPSVAPTNEAFPSANASLTRTNPSFAPAIDSIASASHLPSFELHSPVARANASFTSANEAKTSVSQLPSFPALSRGHQSTAPAKLLKTKHRPEFSRESFSRKRLSARFPCRSRPGRASSPSARPRSDTPCGRPDSSRTQHSSPDPASASCGPGRTR